MCIKRYKYSINIGQSSKFLKIYINESALIRSVLTAEFQSHESWSILVVHWIGGGDDDDDDDD
jgi:hypothetical protein